MNSFKEKKELPVFVVAVLIFLSSLGFLAFAVYYIAFLPVPMVMQPLRVRILTTLQVDELKRSLEESSLDEGETIEDDNFIEN